MEHLNPFSLFDMYLHDYCLLKECNVIECHALMCICRKLLQASKLTVPSLLCMDFKLLDVQTSVDKAAIITATSRSMVTVILL